ncbi:MAG TPA: hypothetical protein VG605_07655 [Puia sp.]|jgi:hypothetical protein|nr:hypothetical protein [Puia sp.]
MKKVFFPLFALICFSACAPMPVAQNFNDSYLMHVECTPDAVTRDGVMVLLRRARCKDVRMEVVGGFMTVEAAYYKADTDPGLLGEIADDLRRMGTVSFVDLRDNPSVVRENR